MQELYLRNKKNQSKIPICQVLKTLFFQTTVICTN